jgi:chromosome segregation ATPase
MESIKGVNLIELVKKLSSVVDYYQKKYPTELNSNPNINSYPNPNPNPKYSNIKVSIEDELKEKNSCKNTFSISEDFLNITTPIFKVYEDKINQSKEQIDKLNSELKKMEKNSNNLLKENMKKSKEINDVISKYKELGNEMHNLSSKSYELEKKNSIMEDQYNKAKNIIESIERELEKRNDTITEYEDKLLELGEKSKIIINENTELDSENSNLKKEIQKKDKIFQTKENELKALSNGKDDIIRILQKRINKLTEDNEILLNNYNLLSDSYKKACISQNNSVIIQNKANSLEVLIHNQEKRINELMGENLKLEEKIGRITNENNSLKSSNQNLNNRLNESNKENEVLKEKSNELNKEINKYKSYIAKYENLIDDYKCCLKELNMEDYLNNFPYVLPKVLFNAIKKIKRLNDKRLNNEMENTSNYSNSKNNNFTSKTTSNNEMKSIDESIERIQREHDDALRKISQLSYENDAL